MAKVLIEDTSLQAIADAIRTINGTTTKYTPTEMATAIQNIMDSASYILVDETGKELAATYVDAKTAFDATANDIREGKTAATDTGVTLGAKEIPAYYTQEGTQYISPGDRIIINMYSDRCQYTKLQALICRYNSTPEDSVATEKVSIDGKVYSAGSAEALAEVSVDIANQAIDLGITNTSENPIIIRYFTFKEEQ